MTRAALGSGTFFVLIAVFIDMLGMGIIMPVLPVFVGEFTADRESQAYWVGAVMAGYGLMQFLCTPLMGALADRFGRKPLLIAAIVGLGIHYVVMGLAPTLWLVLAARIIGGITGATFSVAGAYAADVSTHQDRAKAFGQIGAAFGLGFICGPILGGLLGEIDLRLPLYVAAGFSLLNAIYGVLVLPESLPPERRTPFSIAKANPFASLVSLGGQHGVGRLVAVYAFYSLAHMMLVTTWVLYTNFRYDWGTRENGIALFCVGLLAATVQGLLLGRLVRALGEERLALIGLTVGVFVYLAYGLATEGWMIYAILFAGFIGFATAPTLQGIVSNATDPNTQGLTLGTLTAITSLSGVVAPVIGTTILAQVAEFPGDDMRAGAPFYLCAALQLAALLLAAPHLVSRLRAAAAN